MPVGGEERREPGDTVEDDREFIGLTTPMAELEEGLTRGGRHESERHIQEHIQHICRGELL